jgi:hypothetical protein
MPMDGRQPRSQDGSGDIHVGLDSSAPCWNDAIDGILLQLTEAHPPIFSKEHTKDSDLSDFCFPFLVHELFYLVIFASFVVDILHKKPQEPQFRPQ